jgi:hypothetical protein
VQQWPCIVKCPMILSSVQHGGHRQLPFCKNTLEICRTTKIQWLMGLTIRKWQTKLEQLLQRKSLYNQFRATPHFILQRHHYLFKACTLKQRLQLDIDCTNCWIISVEEAIQTLNHHKTQQQINSSRFFAQFFSAGRTASMTWSQESDSSDKFTHPNQIQPALPEPHLLPP